MRLVTRGDLDGLTASVLISEMEQVDDILLVHPQDITDHKIEITPDDILANLPYHPSCALWFDHHAHTVMPEGSFKGAHKVAPSVARVIYDHYASPRLTRFSELVHETDRFDSATLETQDVLDPQGVILLGFLIDPRTGLKGNFREFFISLNERIRSKGVEALLREPDLREKIRILKNDNQKFQEFLSAHSREHGKVVVTDFRDLANPPVGNRFLIYTLFPNSNVWLRIQWGPERKFVALNIGHSIFNRSCSVDVGELCRNYGGGGHYGAGACVLRPATAELAIKVITRKLEQG